MEALDKVQVLQPDIVLLTSARWCGIARFEVLNQLQHQSRPKVIVVTMRSDEASVFEAFRLGCSGYVIKQASASDLLEAIRRVAAGGNYYSPSIEHLIRRAAFNCRIEPGAGALTRCETIILPMVADGLSNLEIARHLSVSERTVEKHRANFMRKLRLHSHAAVLRYAIRHGSVDL
ncbi:MAG: response regulator transcription factor [Verrucomicrobiota bacterium]